MTELVTPRGLRLDDTMVVFDWNGTIMSDRTRAAVATNAVLAAHNLPAVTEREFCDGFALPLHDWLASLGIAADGVERAEQEWNAAVAAIPAPPRPEAAAVLAALQDRGALLAVVSAASRAAVETDIARTGLTGAVGRVLTDVADKTRQLNSLRHLRERAVYVGDTEHDMACARQAGFTAVAITGGYRSSRALRAAAQTDVMIDSLAELAEILSPSRS